ncbi:uncharacterized protein LOC106637458 [Copidosoma floridanum]|uniref:uncharacterized protein LOC106637458 n=1 Tax=Copidosoma floridanum TaxID=29053 RepID=UPI0006C980C7|nr:uncharacterized protein LOC106637458 [Copidosoma floridanum]
MFKQASEFNKKIASRLVKDETTWSFIPANSPHYGGLLEVGVKSIKHHLKRVIDKHILTYEELTTIFVQIEAWLNSRPLSALSSGIDDLQAITPSHFLNKGVSTLILKVPQPNLPENRLTHLQLFQRIRNNFWKGWSSEYVLELQKRKNGGAQVKTLRWDSWC